MRYGITPPYEIVWNKSVGAQFRKVEPVPASPEPRRIQPCVSSEHRLGVWCCQSPCAHPSASSRCLAGYVWRSTAGLGVACDEHRSGDDVGRQRRDDGDVWKCGHADSDSKCRQRRGDARAGELLRCYGKLLHRHPSAGHSTVDQRRNGNAQVPPGGWKPQL